MATKESEKLVEVLKTLIKAAEQKEIDRFSIDIYRGMYRSAGPNWTHYEHTYSGKWRIVIDYDEAGSPPPDNVDYIEIQPQDGERD